MLRRLKAEAEAAPQMQGVFSVWDAKAEAYLQPFFARKDAVALRMFRTEVNNPDSDFCRHAEDYVLFRIGSFCQDSAQLVEEKHSPLGKAIELKEAVV